MKRMACITWSTGIIGRIILHGIICESRFLEALPVSFLKNVKYPLGRAIVSGPNRSAAASLSILAAFLSFAMAWLKPVHSMWVTKGGSTNRRGFSFQVIMSTMF